MRRSGLWSHKQQRLMSVGVAPSLVQPLCPMTLRSKCMISTDDAVTPCCLLLCFITSCLSHCTKMHLSQEVTWSHSSSLRNSRAVSVAVLCTVGMLLLLFSLHHGDLGYRRHAQSTIEQAPEPEHGESYAMPKDMRLAVARSEELWRRNLEKRKAFVEQNGGLDNMQMFSTGRRQGELHDMKSRLAGIHASSSVYSMGHLRSRLALS